MADKDRKLQKLLAAKGKAADDTDEPKVKAKSFRAPKERQRQPAEPPTSVPLDKPSDKPEEVPLNPVDELTKNESKELMKALERQQKLRREQEKEEAKRLQAMAKELLKKTQDEEKITQRLDKHEDWVHRMASELGFDPDRPITDVPPVPEGMEQVDFQPMRKGKAYIRILYDTATNSHLYEVIEPELNETEKEIMHFLRDTLIRTLDGRQGAEGDTDWEDVLLHAIQQAILDHSILIDDISTQRIQYHLVRDFLGYGRIDAMMSDPMLEDISCDGPGIPVYVFHRTYESVRSNVVFKNDLELDSFVIRLAQRSGKHISIAEPILDATLPDGSRLQTTLSREVTSRGSSFTIRKFRSDPFTPPDLVQYGTMDARMCAFFWLVIENGFSLIMAGGTASGKTTTLNAICQFIPPDRKVVTIEDTREINLNHENWIAGITRSGFGGQLINGQPAGAISMYKLLEAALRQRPEYLMVGEVRGGEALTLFQAMATGHTVYSTMHADSVPSAVYRLENPPINVPRLMLQTLDVMVIQRQVRTKQTMRRRVIEVTEIVGFDPETRELLTNTVFRFDPATDTHRFLGRSSLLDMVMQKKNLSEKELQLEWQNRVECLEWLLEHNVRDLRDVNRVVTEYYQHRERLMDRLRASGPPESYENATAAVKAVTGEAKGVSAQPLALDAETPGPAVGVNGSGAAAEVAAGAAVGAAAGAAEDASHDSSEATPSEASAAPAWNVLEEE